MPTTTLYGVCRLCQQRMPKSNMTRHLRSCLQNLEEKPKAKSQPLYLLKIEDKYDPRYWQYVEMAGSTKMGYLDQFLRDIWLECCDHMSDFQIRESPKQRRERRQKVKELRVQVQAGGRNVKARDKAMYALEKLQWQADEIDENGHMNDSAHAIFADTDPIVEYTYDFGSSTELTIRKVGVRVGKGRRLRLAARNEPVEWKCVDCEKPAVAVCPYCRRFDDAVYCSEHGDEHECEIISGLDELSPIVDSPRMGVCGYTGPAADVCV